MSFFNKKAESEEIYVKILEEAGAVTDDYNAGKFAALEKEMLNDIFENAEDDQDDDREYGEDFDGADDEWVTDEEIEDIVGGRFEGADDEWVTDEEIEDIVGGRFDD